jgi:hypothetical protein
MMELITENWRKYVAEATTNDNNLSEAAQVELALDTFLESYEQLMSESTLTEEELTEGFKELKADLAKVVDVDALKMLAQKYGKKALLLAVVAAAGFAAAGGFGPEAVDSITTVSDAAANFEE